MKSRSKATAGITNCNEAVSCKLNSQISHIELLPQQVGGMFKPLSFLKKFTPKPETTQSIDAAVKLTVELVAFGMIRGLPEDASFEQIADFVIALQDYAKEDVMRIGAWEAIQ